MSVSADLLKTNEKGIIKQFADAQFTGRFLALGIESGSAIKIEQIAFFDGARIVNIDGNKFALRKVELQMIILE